MRSRILLGLALVAAVLAVPVSAQAHNYLVSSTPSADSTISEVPGAFTVTTNESLLDLSGDGNGFAIQVIDEAGLYYGDGCPVVEGSSLSMAASLGPAGLYRLLWQVVSADGHTVSGEFAFTWAPAADAVISAGSPTPPVCGETVIGALEPATTSPTATPATEPTAEASAEPISTDAASGSLPTDALWIGAAALALLVAAGGTAFLLNRRR